MNRDDIIRMAHEADCLDDQHYGTVWANKLERFAHLVAAAERETWATAEEEAGAAARKAAWEAARAAWVAAWEAERAAWEAAWDAAWEAAWYAEGEK